MPILAAPRSKSPGRLAPFVLSLIAGALFAGDAAAGWPHDYSRRWYGQDFYQLQHNGHRNPDGRLRQSSGGYWGPVQMYGREYGDLYGNQRDQPFAPTRYPNRNGISTYSD